MIKLYDDNSYIFDFTAEVVSCEKTGDEYKILLDKTAFFPTAGGQECDVGTINGEPVLHVEIENDEIFHYTKVSFNPGEIITGAIDKEIRIRKMRHHSAEHIVSGLIHSVLGFENVGFHLGDEEVTMDYSGIISEAELIKIEILANRAVRDNLKITCEYPDEDRLSKLNYRSKLDLTENVRIVTVPGVDVCACCAPHVNYTGEIGVIKLKDMIHYKGGVRVRMICAEDALCDFQKKQKNAVRISNLLSVKQDEIADSVEKLHAELAQWKQKCSMLEKSLIQEKVSHLLTTERNICVFENDISIDALRNYVNLGKGKCGGVFVGCIGNDKDGYTYIIASNDVDLTSACKEINQALQGRGGGRGDMVSGRFMCTQREIADYFENYNLQK